MAIFIQVISSKFDELSQASSDSGISSIELSTFYPEGHSDLDDSISGVSYCSSEELEKLFESESNCFVSIKHVKRQLRKVSGPHQFDFLRFARSRKKV